MSRKGRVPDFDFDFQSRLFTTPYPELIFYTFKANFQKEKSKNSRTNTILKKKTQGFANWISLRKNVLVKPVNIIPYILTIA